ncbi:MAG: uncharacterized protein QOE36_3171 [Gaiellaceae bacterium]|nr:uncharacterized protein [Gaiellaceae bacterium]
MSVRLGCGLAIAATLAAGCGSTAQAATRTWTGTFRLPASGKPVSLSVVLAGTRATVALAPGHAGEQTVAASVRRGRVRFALPGRPARIVFDGRIRGSRISGSVAQAKLRGSFRLVPGKAGVLPLLGVYRGSGGTAAMLVRPAGGFPPWLVELPSGDVHGVGATLTVGTRIGDLSGGGTLRRDGARLFWTRAGGTTFYERVRLRQEEVRVGTLAGTLTLPEGQGPFPAVAMVHGSGPQGRDELQTFVDFCALHGIAVLAYDKRGNGQSGGLYPGERATPETVDVLARDAEAAARFLARQPEVDRTRVGLLGDSQAGWITALAASREPAIRWAVLLVGPTIDVGRTDDWASLAGKGLAPPSAPLDQLLAQVRKEAPFGFDPRPALARLTIPVFWIFGDSDRNISTALSVDALEALRPGHDFSWVVLGGTTHTLLDLPSGLNQDIPASRGFARGLYTSIEGWLSSHGIAASH